MKKRILFILLAVVLAVSVSLIGCGGGEQEEEEEEEEELPPLPSVLVAGTVRDTDEGLAIFEQAAAGPVMREFVEYVNDDLGGVELSAYGAGTKVPLEIDMREMSVATWDLGTLTQEICDEIADGTVHFLWGGPGTDLIYTQAPIANAANVVLLTFEGGATGISNDPNKLAVWPYVFISLSYSDWYQLPVLAKILEGELGRTAKVYVVHIQGEHGDEYLSTAEDNFDVVGHAEIPYDASEYGPLVDGVMDAAIAAQTSTPYDLFCCFAYPDHVMMTTGTAMAKGFNPPAMIFGPGANFGFYAYSFGDPPDPAMIEGVMSFTVAAYAAKPEITAVYDRIAARMDDDAGDPYSGITGLPGILTLDYWGIPPYWACLEMWLAAVEEVGYVDQILLRDALAGFEDDPIPTILADETWFRMYGTPGEGGGNLDYLCHTGEIAQWQSGVFETIGYDGITADLPNYITTADFIFPMTDNWGWLP
jgi:hypothetical protein